MRKLNKSNQKSLIITNQSTIDQPITTLRVKLPATNRKSTQRSLSDSIVSTKSENIGMKNSIKLPNAFYDDHNKLYQNRSRLMSQKSLCFQCKPMSFSDRKRYECNKTETIIDKRKYIQSLHSTQPKNITDREKQIESQRQFSKKRFQDVMHNKYRKLVHGASMIKVNKEILQRSIHRNLSQKSVKRWTSPFIGKNSIKDKFTGQELLPKKIQKMFGNQNSDQLKVLNLDRLFRLKQGKLTNVVPLPVAKFNQVSARRNLIKIVKNKDKIHEVMSQYNSLLRLMTLKKTAPRLGVKGKKFTKGPSIEQLMGIKLNVSKTVPIESDQLLEEQIFVNHCEYYKTNIKKNVHLTRRLFAGLIQEQPIKGLTLNAYAKFYMLFVNKIASTSDKTNFLLYFFIPQGQQKIQFSLLKFVLQLMCQDLPLIEKLNLKTDLLSKEQKSKIFLEALNRVLFGDVQHEFINKGGLNRQYLRMILINNPDACDLLLNLLQIE